MDVTAEDRAHLERTLTERLGPEATRTMMAHLPVGGAAALATKDDFDALADELRAEIRQCATKDDLDRFATKDDLRREIAVWSERISDAVVAAERSRSEGREEAARLRAEWKEEMASARAEWKDEMASARAEWKDEVARDRAQFQEAIAETRQGFQQSVTRFQQGLAQTREEFQQGLGQTREEVQQSLGQAREEFQRAIGQTMIRHTIIQVGAIAGLLAAALSIAFLITGSSGP